MSDRLFRLNCGFQNYDWGKHGNESAVAQFASRSDPSIKVDENKPYAELWMGTHPSVPSVAVSGEGVKGKTLREIVSADPKKYLGEDIIKKFGSDRELPFLFKVLSIEKVLSIQAHPDKSLGARLHAEDPKNYPDDNHKPEMAIAVTLFEGFCGFKPLDEIAKTLQAVPELREIVGEEASTAFIKGIEPNAAKDSPEDAENKRLLQQVFGNLMRADQATVTLKASELVSRAQKDPALFDSISPKLSILIERLNKQFPNDIGLFCGCLLLNHVILNPGEAMFLRAKDPHAYINGDIIECMAASDNVVRAGFTPKFKDVKNLVSMLTYAYDPVEKQKMPLLKFPRSKGEASKVVLYDPPIAEFSVLETIFDKPDKTQSYDGFSGPSIIICTRGNGLIQESGASEVYPLETGYVYFVAPSTEIEITSKSDSFTSYRAFVEAN